MLNGKQKPIRIALTGGGTGGSVAPLLAVAKEIRQRLPKCEIVFLGSTTGPERDLVTTAGLPFYKIVAGKYRRYFSFRNVLDLWVTVVGFFQALSHLRSFRPDVVLGAGSYIQVPVVWAAWTLRIPAVIHQQDIQPGLANKISAPMARVITVAFEKSLADFPRRRTRWIGNPVRLDVLRGSRDRGLERFGLHRDLPVVLAFGGGTGALHLNQLIAEAGLDLVKHAQILHITGGREQSFRVQHPNYHPMEFLTSEMGDAYAVADIVICRAGLSTLTEIAALKKPAIVIPIPGTHQERNAEYYASEQAIVLANERELTAPQLVERIIGLLENSTVQERLRGNVGRLIKASAASALADIVISLTHPSSFVSLVKQLQSFGLTVREHEPMAPHTHFRLGGPADVFAVATTKEQIIEALRALKRQKTQWVILGGGANVVIADQGIRGVVLQLRNKEFRVVGQDVTIGAGMNTGEAASRCLQAGLVGLEFIVGIYGTVGGAVRGNAGAFGVEMRDVVTSVEVLTENGLIETWSNEACSFGYRQSLFKQRRATILSVQLKLQPGDVAEARQKIIAHTSYKRSHQPLQFPSAGCLFTNYQLRPDDADLRRRFAGRIEGDRLPAWVLITEAGLAGRRLGGIRISDQHANFFLNDNQGTAEDVVMLASLVKQQVRDQLGVQLREEVQFLGFDQEK